MRFKRDVWRVLLPNGLMSFVVNCQLAGIASAEAVGEVLDSASPGAEYLVMQFFSGYSLHRDSYEVMSLFGSQRMLLMIDEVVRYGTLCAAANWQIIVELEPLLATA